MGHLYHGYVSHYQRVMFGFEANFRATSFLSDTCRWSNHAFFVVWSFQHYSNSFYIKDLFNIFIPTSIKVMTAPQIWVYNPAFDREHADISRVSPPKMELLWMEEIHQLLTIGNHEIGP